MPKYRLAIAAAAAALAAGLTAIDVVADGGPVQAVDLLADFADRLLLLGAMWLIATLVVRVSGLEQEADDLRHGLLRVSDEAERWRIRSRRLVQGLSEAITEQFAEWKLTPAEAEIAGLMLKGLSLRDISVLRHTSEATIRQQAQGIYRKSGLSNRSELAAYFLDDLFEAAERAMPDMGVQERATAKPN
ncbi:helix-turn-helix transcriptional regulator [Albidovulum sp.]|uniref:helix-turn-helix transcriptional regulator n=1 Tax=Albidovulum sp. TaxID=1872424 RepID=UPI0039B97604